MHGGAGADGDRLVREDASFERRACSKVCRIADLPKDVAWMGAADQIYGAIRGDAERRRHLKDEDAVRVALSIKRKIARRYRERRRGGVKAREQGQSAQIAGHRRTSRSPCEIAVGGGQVALRLLRCGIVRVHRTAYRSGRKSRHRFTRTHAELARHDARAGVVDGRTRQHRERRGRSKIRQRLTARCA